jgi:hypothetical protein
MQDLQQRVLFRTHTGFPLDALTVTLHRAATITPAKLTIFSQPPNPDPKNIHESDVQIPVYM